VPPRLLAWAREAALPAYVLHQTVAVLLAYRVLALPLAPLMQWVLLTLLTLALTLGLSEVLRRPPLTRRLLGLRPLPRRGAPAHGPFDLQAQQRSARRAVAVLPVARRQGAEHVLVAGGLDD
jgi:hypothetical protein